MCIICSNCVWVTHLSQMCSEFTQLFQVAYSLYLIWRHIWWSQHLILRILFLVDQSLLRLLWIPRFYVLSILVARNHIYLVGKLIVYVLSTGLRKVTWTLFAACLGPSRLVRLLIAMVALMVIVLIAWSIVIVVNLLNFLNLFYRVELIVK